VRTTGREDEMMADTSCSTCIWFELIENEYGECRFNPPCIVEKLVGGSSYANLFQATKNPIVSQNHRCSKFEKEGSGD
jgi:hypothetical protein